MPPLIAPSILAADLSNLKVELDRVSSADLVHIDVMDGSFVPPITFGHVMIEQVRKSSALFREVHLMISKPWLHLESFCKSGAQRLLIHVEADPNITRTLQDIKDLGMSAGVVINPGTPVEHTFDYLHLCDVLLIMTINPGWAGQKFMDFVVPKFSKASKFIRDHKLKTSIEVDGGINEKTGKLVVDSGCNILVVSSFIYNAENAKKQIDILKNL